MSTDFARDVAERRLLFLLPFSPRLDAPHGGGRVISQLICALPPRYRISLLYMRNPRELPLDERIADRCEFAEAVDKPWSSNSHPQYWGRNLRLAASLLRLRPMWVTELASNRYQRRVRSLIQTWTPDIVQFEYHVMGQYLPALNDYKAPRVLVEYEPGTIAAPYLKRYQSTAGRLLDRLDKLAWQRFEPAVIRQVQAVVVLTARDKRTLEELGIQTPVQVIPAGTVVPNHPLNPLGHPPPSILFVGSFIHPPNVDAAARLLHSIFPPLQSRCPDLELYIVGDQPPNELRQATRDKIVVTGWVPDLTLYMDRAAVVVAPLRSGGGMRVKVLEALAAGKAVVATPLAVEGLDLEDGKQVFLGESDPELVERIGQLLDDPERRAAVASHAYEWACANLGWNTSVDAYDRLYSTLLRQSAA